MSRTTAAHRRARTLLIALVAVCVVLAAAVFWMWRKQPSQPDFAEGRAIADKFLELLRSGQAQTAWESTTAEFKSAEGRESFLRYVKEHSFLTKPLEFVSVQTVTVQNSPRAEFVYRSQDGKSTVRLLAGDERGTWRIDRIALN